MLTVKLPLPLLHILTVAPAVAWVLLTNAACGAGGVRPTFAPFPEAITDTVPGAPDRVVEQLSEMLVEEGLELRWSRAREGYVETKWFNAETGDIGGGRSLNTEDVVRLRFWTDLALEHESVVIAEAVRRRVFDPSLPARQTETPLSPDHPIYGLVRRLLDELSLGGHGHAQ